MIPGRRGKIYVTGADNTVNFSGCAYFFMRSLQEELPDFEVEALPVQPYRALYGATARWGLQMRVDPRRYFFMTREFMDANWRASHKTPEPDAILISFPQIAIGAATQKFARTFLYTDMTHQQYLSYKQFEKMPRRVHAKIIAQEKTSYAAADRIFAATGEVRDQLVERYLVDAGKIEIIGRGLNMPPTLPDRKATLEPDDRLRIGFLGYDFERKGLLDLIEAIDADDSLQKKVAVEVIGPKQNQLPFRPYMSVHGYINKGEELDRLIEIMDRCHIAYLFSRSEGIPGSILDFLSRGVPCLISDIAPMRDIAQLPGVVSLPLSQGAAVVGDTLRALLASPERLRSLRAEAMGATLPGWKQQARSIGRWCQV